MRRQKTIIHHSDSADLPPPHIFTAQFNQPDVCLQLVPNMSYILIPTGKNVYVSTDSKSQDGIRNFWIDELGTSSNVRPGVQDNITNIFKNCEDTLCNGDNYRWETDDLRCVQSLDLKVKSHGNIAAESVIPLARHVLLPDQKMLSSSESPLDLSIRKPSPIAEVSVFSNVSDEPIDLTTGQSQTSLGIDYTYRNENADHAVDIKNNGDEQMDINYMLHRHSREEIPREGMLCLFQNFQKNHAWCKILLSVIIY